MGAAMSDERLAEIRSWQDAPRPGSERQVAPGCVPELLAEVDRLRAALAEAERRHHDHAWAAVARANESEMRMADERDEAGAALARVKALHRKGTVSIISFNGPKPDREVCLTCSGADEGEMFPFGGEGVIWPCPTIREIEGADDE